MLLPTLISKYWQEEMQGMFCVFLRDTDGKERQATCFLIIKFRYHNEIVQRQCCNLPKNKYPIYLLQFMGKVIFFPQIRKIYVVLENPGQPKHRKPD